MIDNVFLHVMRLRYQNRFTINSFEDLYIYFKDLQLLKHRYIFIKFIFYNLSIKQDFSTMQNFDYQTIINDIVYYWFWSSKYLKYLNQYSSTLKNDVQKLMSSKFISILDDFILFSNFRDDGITNEDIFDLCDTLDIN